MSDIRKWFMKQHDKGHGNVSKPAKPATTEKVSPAKSRPEKPVQGGQENLDMRKTSKYFDKKKPEDERMEVSGKRKPEKGNEKPPDVETPRSKKLHKVEDDDADDDLVLPKSNKELKSGSGRGIAQKLKAHGSDEEKDDGDEHTETPSKHAGRGCGGRGGSAGPAGGRRRGSGGRGGFMNFGERKDPPHKGEKFGKGGSRRFD